MAAWLRRRQQRPPASAPRRRWLRRLLCTALIALPVVAIALIAADVLARYLPALRALQDGQRAAVQAESILRHDPAHLTSGQLHEASVLLRQASADFDGKSTIIDHGWLADVAARLPWVQDQVDVVRSIRRVGIAATALGLDALPLLQDILPAPGEQTGALARVLSATVHDQAALDRVERDLTAVTDAARQLPTRRVSGPLRKPQMTVVAEVPRLVGALQTLKDILNGVTAAAGAGRHTYLLLLTNPGEERPGGGFIGALGQVTLSDGQVVSTNFRASDFANGIVTSVPAPPPLDRYLFHGHPWELSDANWWADFPTSAREVSAFYEQATGEKVDGVISVDPVALSLVLGVLGPVQVAPYPQIITADNALREINYIINKARPDDPGKAYLAPLGQTVLERLLRTPVQQYPALAAELASAVHGKHIAMLFADDRVQQVVARYNAGGTLRSTGGDDGLMVADANLSGSKADLFVTRHFELAAAIDDNGTVHDRLTLSYHNTVPTSAADRNLLPGSGGAYRDYLRAYLPASAQVDRLVLTRSGRTTEVSPETISQESGRLAVAFYLVVPPGADASLEIDYHGAFAHRSSGGISYQLTWSKQTDALTWPVHVTAVTGRGTRREWASALDSDQHWSLIESIHRLGN